MVSFLQYKVKVKLIEVLEFFNKYFNYNYLTLVFIFWKSVGAICVGFTSAHSEHLYKYFSNWKKYYFNFLFTLTNILSYYEEIRNCLVIMCAELIFHLNNELF